MTNVHDFNTKNIAEFRENHGKLGGMFEGAPMLILHTTGAKSGSERLNPLMYQQVGDDVAVFASFAGAPTNPAWYHNLLVHPEASIELGDDVISVRARTAEGDERERIWSRQKEVAPQFAEYETKTTRVIPVVILERR
jgi:deazaflavin-dependent oxidoreductase (nitroreductase family)